MDDDHHHHNDEDDKDDDDDDDDAEFGCRAGSLASKEPAGLSCLTWSSRAASPALEPTRAASPANVLAPDLPHMPHKCGASTRAQAPLQFSSKNGLKFAPLSHHKCGASTRAKAPLQLLSKKLSPKS